MTERYVVLGDVVDSREIADRDAFQGRLDGACRAVNERHAAAIHAPFAVLKGVDELGAVLTDPTVVYDVARTFADRLAPQRLRLVVARGEVYLGVETRDVARMDGPAFHRANELLAGAERDGLLFDAAVTGSPLDTAVADEVNLLLGRRVAWTDRQREVVTEYRRRGTQTAAAEALGISQQAVSKALGSVDWRMVETVEERLAGTLEAMAG